MQAPRHFSESYAEARTRFLEAVARAGASVESFENPVGKGPAGETLATDVALFGPSNARHLLVLMSGTHGVEGFAGSGIQTSMIEGLRFRSLPARTAVLVIHAINPYGFAWLRRTNEHNIDLNRNAIDFGNLPAPDPHFAALAPHLVPIDWPDLVPAESAVKRYIAEHGFRRFREVVGLGQYVYPDSLFYGGTESAWSSRLFQEIVTRYGKSKRKLAVIDYHTGLGPIGYGEPIFIGTDEKEAARVREWYGPDVTAIHAGDSASVVVVGSLISAVPSFFKDEESPPEVTTLALEYGTLPEDIVLDVLRAEAWMHNHGDINFDSPVGRAIKRRFRDAFYVDTDVWKRRIVERAFEMTDLALAGLAS